MSDRSATASPAAVLHLRWSLAEEVGPILFGRIIEHFGSAQDALAAGVQTLQGVDGIGPVLADRIARSRDAVSVDRELQLAEQHGVRILCREDEEYPAGLRHIPDPPICLYVLGRLEPADAVAVSVVGSRRCTIYGREQAYRFGHQLAVRGVTVISGLARGVDGESHKGALAAGGRTLAVLGNGLAGIYPPEHRELARRVAECGAIVSELPMATSPARENFLPRNRLIAGLSLGVLVVEAARRSGSLSTAARAAEYNREVFAIPGRIDSEFSAGTNALIRDQHAKLVTGVDDILDELGEAGKILLEGTVAESTTVGARPILSEDERAILDSLDHEERSIETIADATHRAASKVASTLITLQLKGLIRQLPGSLFVKAGQRPMSRVVGEIVDAYVFRRTSDGEVQFLMLHRSPGRYLGGTWQAVHGRIEPGETAWQAALREIREETAVVPSAFYQVDTVNTFYMAVDDTVHHCPCFAAEVEANATVALNDEHDAFEWVPADAALERFIWPGQRRAVREILEEIIRPGPAVEHLRIRL